MKQAKRRLLSLLMAMALVCSLLPTAFAEDVYTLTFNPSSFSVRAGEGVTLIPSVTKKESPGSPISTGVTYSLGSDAPTGFSLAGTTLNTNAALQAQTYTVPIVATFTDNGSNQSASASVSVTVTAATNTVVLSETARTLNSNESFTLRATTVPANQSILWSSSDPSIANVTQDGVVTAYSAGNAIITAAFAANPTVKATCTVTVVGTAAPVLSLNKSSILLNYGTTVASDTLVATVSGLTAATAADYYVNWTVTANTANVSLNTTNSLTGSTSSISTYFSNPNSSGTYTSGTAWVLANTTYGTATVTATLYSRSAGTAVPGTARSCTVTVGNSGYSVSLSCSPNSNTSVPLNYYYDYPDYWYDRDPYYYGYRDITVTPVIYQNGAAIYNGSSGATGSTTSSGSGSLRVSISYAWTLGSTPLNSYNSSSTWNSYYTNSSSGNSSTARIYARDVYNYYSTSSRNLICTVTVTLYNGAGGVVWSNSSSRASASWTVYSSTYYNFEVSATVYQGENYYLNTTNTDTRTSVLDQINNYIQSNSGRSLSSVSFSSTSSNGSSLSASSGYTYSYGSTTTGTLSGIYFTPTSAAISSTSQASFRFTATDSAGASYSGTLVVNVKPGTTVGGSFSMTGTAGQNVTLKLSDFTNWWKNMYPSGSLSYVDFTSVSAGSLHTSSGGSVTVSANSATHCYATASGTRTLIEGLIYTPTTSTSASTVTIKFTGHGTGTSGGNAATYARTGTLTINLNAPAIVQNLSVAYSCTSSTGVSFRPSDFYNSNATAMAACSYVTFGTPSSGSLYAANSPVAAGTQFSLGSSQGMTSVSGVTYRPASGYNGAVTIPFYAYNSAGTQIGSGTVSISVSQPVQQEKPTVPTTPKKTFSDVTANNWYYTDVTTLVNAGIVDGRSDGKFHPNDNVTYGEALKLILVAAGYPKQTEGTGSNWAMPYYRLALEEGLTPSNGSALGLNEAIDRNTIAEIACKALDLTPVTDASSSPFTDSDNPYVLALNAVNIIRGTSGTTFEGENTLKRSEICAIVCRIYSYNSSGQQPDSGSGDNTTPSGDTSGDNTVAPGWV